MKIVLIIHFLQKPDPWAGSLNCGTVTIISVDTCLPGHTGFKPASVFFHQTLNRWGPQKVVYFLHFFHPISWIGIDPLSSSRPNVKRLLAVQCWNRFLSWTSVVPRVGEQKENCRRHNLSPLWHHHCCVQKVKNFYSHNSYPILKLLVPNCTPWGSSWTGTQTILNFGELS